MFTKFWEVCYFDSQKLKNMRGKKNQDENDVLIERQISKVGSLPGICLSIHN
jgi:hypothetical protein